jgi:hypothetical protein
MTMWSWHDFMLYGGVALFLTAAISVVLLLIFKD